MVNDIPKQFRAKAKVERDRYCTYFGTGIVAQHYLRAVWQQKCNSIPWIDSSLQQGGRQAWRESAQLSISVGFVFKNQSNLERKRSACVVQEEIQHAFSRAFCDYSNEKMISSSKVSKQFV